eukprot:7139770-Alexandrium_andersonii.AAC.1
MGKHRVRAGRRQGQDLVLFFLPRWQRCWGLQKPVEGNSGRGGALAALRTHARYTQRCTATPVATMRRVGHCML